MSNDSITIETSPTLDNISKCHPQQQSPLLNLPAELTNHIFTYATMPHYSGLETGLGQSGTDYYPGCVHRYTTYTDLLLTCRRIWLEANHLPMQQARHVFWDRGIRHIYRGDFFHREAKRFKGFIKGLTSNSLRNLTEVLIFVNKTWLQSPLPEELDPLVGNKSLACPRILTVVIDRSAWGSWRYDQPLILLAEQPWLNELLTWPAPHRLREIRVIVETMESRCDEFQPIINATREKFNRVEKLDSSGYPCRVVLGDSPPSWSYSASTNPWLQRASRFIDSDRGDCRVVTLVWRVERAQSKVDNAESGPSSSCDVHGLTAMPSQTLPISGVEDDGPSSESSSRHEDSWKKSGSLLKLLPCATAWAPERCSSDVETGADRRYV